jgi:hypothetical protein
VLALLSEISFLSSRPEPGPEAIDRPEAITLPTAGQVCHPSGLRSTLLGRTSAKRLSTVVRDSKIGPFPLPLFNTFASQQQLEMADPKAALPSSKGTGTDTSTLGTQLSSLSVTDESENSSPPAADYQVFVLAGFGHKYVSLTSY